jgi:hypothetical protein
MKRLLVLLLMTICLVFAGAQSTQMAKSTGTVQADDGYICGDPYIDPIDGRCYQACCPSNPNMGLACYRRPCLD